jgi:hypothetical protein
MAVLAVSEFDTHPASPSQFYRYFNRTDDVAYEQTEVVSIETRTFTIGTNKIARSANVVTVDFDISHDFEPGESVIISGVTDTSFNGTFVIDSITSDTIKVLQSGTNATSSSGTAKSTYPTWLELTSGREVRESVRITDTIARTKYPGRDFQTYLDESISWLKEEYADSFNSFFQSDYGIMFLTYVSRMQDELSWYLDMEATEFYYALLRLRSRAEELARYLAYKPKAATACSSDMTITLDEGPYAKDILLPAGFKLNGPDGLIFELINDLIFTAGQTEKTNVSVTQGESLEDIYVSTGEAHQRFELGRIPDGQYVADGSVRVWSGGDEWTEYEFLPFGRLNGFEVVYGVDPPYVLTGDSVVGNIPVQDQQIRITYRATTGKLGKKATKGTIDSVAEALIADGVEIPLTVVSTSDAVGGDDIESIESIKGSAPQYFKTADRGVTKEDMTTLVNKFQDGALGSVAIGKANIVRGIASDYALQALIAAIDGNASTLEGYLNAISAQGDSITTSADNIDSERATLVDEASDATSSLEDAEHELDLAKNALSVLPYKDVIGQGDGSAKTFGSALTNTSISEGSVAVWATGFTELDSGNDGDCSTARRLSSASANFTANYIGNPIEISGQTRQITRYISANTIEYSGASFTGTNVTWVLFEKTVFGVDDGSGNISGVGIEGGSTINYTTGYVDVNLSSAPDYGALVMCQYGYEGSAGETGTRIDNALSDISNAKSNLSTIDTGTSSSSTIATEVIAIKSAITSIDGQITLALLVPAAVESDVDDLESYLDEHFSGECRANIVMVQALVVDVDGFYTAPSQALLTGLKSYLSSHNVLPTTVATVSGYRNIIAVDMTVEIKVSDQYMYSDVVVSVQNIIDDMFKNRIYGENLLRGTYYGLIVPNPVTGQGGVAGVARADISITATSFPDPSNTETAPSVDSDGNLIIGEDYILTRGTITYSEILS